MDRSERICIVDAYSTGAELAPLFARSGLTSIHVQSSVDIPEDFKSSFRPDHFVENVVARPESWEMVLERVAEFGPSNVLPGTETGVPLADFLSTRLALPGNDASNSALRRDKFEMQEALRRAGLAAIEQARVASVEEATDWCKQRDRWPVVVKPLDSAGADAVRFCNNVVEVADAVRAIIGFRNRIGIQNIGALLQARLHGEQYFVNAVSIDGVHVFTEIWADHKTEVAGAALICDKEELLPYEGAVQDMILAYMNQALTVLGVRNGPSHSELMLTTDGPVLIETAARMQGTIQHEAVVAALGDSHVTCTAERYVDPEHFRRRAAQPYRLRSGLFCVTLQSHTGGLVVRNNCLDLIGTLPSFHTMFHTPLPGERVERTTDLFSNPGIIYLLHDKREQLEEDYGQIRDLEARGLLFTLEKVS